MPDPSIATQAALVAALSGISAPVYDRVPSSAGYPRVTIDTQAAVGADMVDHRLDERLFYLRVWSIANGQHEALGIMSEIDTALHRKRGLTMTTGRWVFSEVVRKATQREPDNETFMGRVTVRVLTEH